MNVIDFLCDKFDELEGILKTVIKVRTLDIEMKIVQFTYAQKNKREINLGEKKSLLLEKQGQGCISGFFLT